MYKIDNPFVTMLQTKVREKQTEAKELQEALFKLGEYMSTEIIGKEFLKAKIITTPLEEEVEGFALMQKKTIILSTKDDYKYFAAGIMENFDNCASGYMDFDGLRGREALSSPISAVGLPAVKNGEIVDTVIVAKSVLATGCTAVSILKDAIKIYEPINIIVASVFYSKQGVMELKMKFPRCRVYVCGNPDSINKEGMLVPGIGNLDSRLKTIGM